MIDHDTLYYRGRLSEERARALQAMTREASAAHRALAELYRQRLDRLAVGSWAFKRRHGQD